MVRTFLLVFITLLLSFGNTAYAKKETPLLSALADDLFQLSDLSYNIFKGKYGNMPGDTDKAIAFGLGEAGDGNKKLSHKESKFFWQHLFSAELLPRRITNFYKRANPKLFPYLLYSRHIALYPHYIETNTRSGNAIVILHLDGNGGISNNLPFSESEFKQFFLKKSFSKVTLSAPIFPTNQQASTKENNNSYYLIWLDN